MSEAESKLHTLVYRYSSASEHPKTSVNKVNAEVL